VQLQSLLRSQDDESREAARRKITPGSALDVS